MKLLQDKFISLYGTSHAEVLCCFAPGRINLIGEHIDYNGGPVMPFPISNGTALLLRKNDLGTHRFFSVNFPEKMHTVRVQNQYHKIENHWYNYPLACLEMLNDINMNIPVGIDFLFSGDIPNGAGLSSSASIEVVTLFGLNEYFNLSLHNIDIVKLAMRAENDFIGLSCGIMDQYAVTFGKSGHVLLLQCDIPEHKYVPADLGEYEIMAVHTGVKRGLTSSKYNERYTSCMEALMLLKPQFNINNLCDLSTGDLSEIASILGKDSELFVRTRHVVTEKHRVLQVEKALQNMDMDLLGRLLNESHDSLKNDYEVTGYELDSLVEVLQSIEGVSGARMTGAGFGGCAVSLAKKGVIQQHIPMISEKYRALTGLQPEFYPAVPSEGVRLTAC
jgi:galactokinase